MGSRTTTKPNTALTSGAVLNINDFRNRDVVQLCELLLQKAKAGEITGLIYMARINGDDDAVSAIGCYAKHSQVAMPAMARMAGILQDHVHRNI